MTLPSDDAFTVTGCSAFKLASSFDAGFFLRPKNLRGDAHAPLVRGRGSSIIPIALWIYTLEKRRTGSSLGTPSSSSASVLRKAELELGAPRCIPKSTKAKGDWYKTVGPALVAETWHADERQPYKSPKPNRNWYHSWFPAPCSILTFGVHLEEAMVV